MSRHRFLQGKRRFSIIKPRGVIVDRVKKVGPAHFGIVCVDPAKARSTWALFDFFGEVLVEPTVVRHAREDLKVAVDEVRDGMRRHSLKDLVVSIEQTGRYHLTVKRVFQDADFDVRIIHPFVTKQYRLPADPGNKTDGTDLGAMHRATTNGFGLGRERVDPFWEMFQMVVRQRRDLVKKRSKVYTQMKEHLLGFLPGMDRCFDDMWVSEVGLWIAERYSSPVEIVQAGPEGLRKESKALAISAKRPTLLKVLAWARQAPSVGPQAAVHRRFYLSLNEDRLEKSRQIGMLEREMASLLARTPYVLLLSIPAINVVSAADFAGEMGPIEHYTHSRAITGRAGLFPSRYNSDQVDLKDGPIVGMRNRRLRATIMTIADNLVSVNDHFRQLGAGWRLAGKDPRDTRVKVGCRFARIAFHMVSGRQVFSHPCVKGRDHVLDKLLASLKRQGCPESETRCVLESALAQLPEKHYPEEATSLRTRLARKSRKRTFRPMRLGEILEGLLARMGVEPDTNKGTEGPRN